MSHLSQVHDYNKLFINYSFLKIRKDNKLFLLAKICQLQKYRISLLEGEDFADRRIFGEPIVTSKKSV